MQVHLIETEALKGPRESGPGVGLPGILNPQLGGDEQLAAGDAAGPHRRADIFLVLVGGGGVEAPRTDRSDLSGEPLGIRPQLRGLAFACNGRGR